MLLLLFAFAMAVADTEPWQGEFAVGTRTDAPTDALVLYETSEEVLATVVSGPGAPFDLVVEVLVANPSGNTPHGALHPPDGGWEPGATYTVEVEDIWATDAPPFASLTFTAGSEVAPPTLAPVVSSSEVGDWSEETDYLWGCCEPVRTVTFEVESQSDDPWSYVELKGTFEGSGQIATTPVLHRLAIGVGTGTHTLSYDQWDEGATLQPPCFEVAHVSSSGARSEAETFCFDEDGRLPGECGCATTQSHGYSLVLVAALLAILRRRRSGASTAVPENRSAPRPRCTDGEFGQTFALA